MSWGVVYYADEDGVAPALQFLASCPVKVRAKLAAVLEAVRAAPPPAFSGGGKWEAMHGSMGGCYEIRVTGPGRQHYRLFCALDNGTPRELAERGFDRPQIAVINGLVKANATLFTEGNTRSTSGARAGATSPLSRDRSQRDENAKTPVVRGFLRSG